MTMTQQGEVGHGPRNVGFESESAGGAHVERGAALDVPQNQLLEMLGGYGVSFAIRAGMEVGLFRAIGAGEGELGRLSASLGLHEPALKRLVRVLVSVGLLIQSGEGKLSVSELAHCLLPGTEEEPLGVLAEYLASDSLVHSMVDLSHSLRTGKPAFEKRFGVAWYDYGRLNPQHLELMDRVMAVYSGAGVPAQIASYPFAEARSIVDVGGGVGQLICLIAQQSPNTECVLFDLPATAERARRYVSERMLEGRVQVVAGDMFDTVPENRELYVVSKVLNDWDDLRARRILSNISSVMSASGRVVIVEDVESEEVGGLHSALRDLFLTACSGGGNRTMADWEALVQASGLTIGRIIQGQGQFSIIECNKPRSSRRGPA